MLSERDRKFDEMVNRSLNYTESLRDQNLFMSLFTSDVFRDMSLNLRSVLEWAVLDCENRDDGEKYHFSVDAKEVKYLSMLIHIGSVCLASEAISGEMGENDNREGGL